MKSRTSFFNESILRKNITRFSPLWAIYLVFGVLITFFVDISGYDFDPADFAELVCYSMIAMAPINLGYAALSALLLFGDLHKTRMCYSLHAMPMRREGWFLTHVLSGLSFSVFPNLIVTLILLMKCGSYFHVPFAWLLVSTLQYLCFFGIAVFSMHITGKNAAAICMYLLISFFFLLLYGLTELYFGQFWEGVVIPMEPFEEFVPLTKLMEVYLEPEYDNMSTVLRTQWMNFGAGFLWAGAGIVFLALALLVYRKRHLESAGDFITLRPAAPVVLVIYTVSVGGVLWAIFYFNYFVLLLGLAIGFFTGRMLLQRTVKVFQKRNFLGYGILAACVLLSIGLARLDPIGITRWVPEQDDVQCVFISDNSYNLDRERVALDSDADIALVLQLHEYAVENAIEPHSDRIFEYSTDTYVRTSTVYIRYKLKNGGTATRYYLIPVADEGGRLLHLLYSEPEYLYEGYIDDTMDLMQCSYIHFENYTKDDGTQTHMLPEEDYEGLLQAMELDRLDGALVQDWAFHENGETLGALELAIPRENGRNYLYIRVFDNCTHTITWLEKNGYL